MSKRSKKNFMISQDDLVENIYSEVDLSIALDKLVDFFSERESDLSEVTFLLKRKYEEYINEQIFHKRQKAESASKEIKDHVRNDRILPALEALHYFFKVEDAGMNDVIIILQNEYTEYKMNYYKGALASEKLRENKARIISRILQIVDEAIVGVKKRQ